VNSFENDPRRQQEIRGRPIADKIYCKQWGSDIEIVRTEFGEDCTLDQEFAIDVVITFPNGQILIGQEKFLSHQYASFGTITIEYEQNQNTGEKGDWFKGGWMFYFTGYFTKNEDGFMPWVLANYPSIVLATQEDRIIWRLRANNDGKALASFMWTNIAELPNDVVIARYTP